MLYNELKKLLFEEANISIDSMKRRIKRGLFVKCDLGTVRKYERMKVAIYRIVPWSYSSLSDIDVALHDAVMFVEKMPRLEFLEYIRQMIRAEISGKTVQSNLEFNSAIGVIYWDSKKVFYSVFNPNTNLYDDCYCIKGEEIISILMQARCLNKVFSEPDHFEWLKHIVTKSYKNNVRRITVNFFNQTLNNSQKEAVEYALSAIENEEFYLIQGPPGTGKTTTIAEIIYQALERGKRVLITSHTNVAIDNALEKFMTFHGKKLSSGEVVRLGHIGKVSKEIRELVPKPDVDISYYLENSKVVGATISKLALLNFLGFLPIDKPTFDVAIVDESSMATIPMTLIPLANAKSFILVGDQHQLPPIVRASEVSEDAAKSLFENLINHYPSSMLRVQYRSNIAIAEYSSRYVYDGMVKTADNVKDIKLNINANGFKGPLQDILKPENIIVWIEHDSYPKWLQRRSTGRYSAVNLCEAAITLRVLETLFNAGVKDKDVGVISYYRLQADLLKKSIDVKFEKTPIVESLEDVEDSLDARTVDAYQGREKDVIIVNFVNNKEHKALDDYRRLNVAITRAKKKLILIGSMFLKRCYNWSYNVNPASLYFYIKDDLQSSAFGKNRGGIITISCDEISKDLKLVERLYSELVSFDNERRQRDSLFTDDDIKVLKYLRRKRWKRIP